MKWIFIFVFVFNSFSGISQTNADHQLDYQYICDNYVLKPTVFTITTLLHASGSQFKKIMTQYNYSLTTDRKAYISNTSIDCQPFYTITKSNNSVALLYTSDDYNFAGEAKKELRKMTKAVKYLQGGGEEYKLLGEMDGIQFKYSFYISERDGGTVVGVKFL